MKNLFVFYFANDEAAVAHFCVSDLMDSIEKTHAFSLIPISEHSLYSPLTVPLVEGYDPKDRVIIALGDTIPFRCHFNFLPPNEETEQVRVDVIDIGKTPKRPDYSKIMIAVRKNSYHFEPRRPM